MKCDVCGLDVDNYGQFWEAGRLGEPDALLLTICQKCETPNFIDNPVNKTKVERLKQWIMKQPKP